MAWSWTPRRRDEPELMDAPGLPEHEVAAAYRVLQKVNRQLGNLKSIDLELRTMLAEDRPPSGCRITLLDVGSGSGDVPSFLRNTLVAQGFSCRALALDRDTTALRLAARQPLEAVKGDAVRLPFADRSVDLVTAVKFAHHFSGTRLVNLVGEMARVAARRVVVLDIRRHWLAYWGFIAWSRLFTRNRLVRYDGPLSVLRGFTAEELAALPPAASSYSWTVRSYPGFQLALVGRRLEPSPGTRA